MILNGTVKFFREDKGFGFISGDDGKEYFVHKSGLPKGVVLREGAIVAFSIEKGDRGLKAVNVVNGHLSTTELIDCLQDINYSGILGPDGNLIPTGGYEERIIVTDIRSVTEELLRLLDKNPELLREITSRKFEEVIAECLYRQGCQVTLTPESRDGGFDVYAAKKDNLGSWLFLVECKRFAVGRKVGVNFIRNLHGVVQHRNATAGILATTSFFTKPAKEFQRTIEFQMSLVNYFGIQRWIKDALQNKPNQGRDGAEPIDAV